MRPKLYLNEAIIAIMFYIFEKLGTKKDNLIELTEVITNSFQFSCINDIFCQIDGIAI